MVQAILNRQTLGQTESRAMRVTIEDILTHCEVSKKAIVVVNELNFFLRTQEDREKFIELYESRFVWEKTKKTSIMMDIAKEIGSYHYKYNDLMQLQTMNIQDAMSHLFNEPVNCGMMKQYQLGNHTLSSLYSLKKAMPELTFMISLLY